MPGFQCWVNEEPDNDDGGNDCMQLAPGNACGRSDYLWDTTDCNRERYAVCERGGQPM